MGIKWDDVHIGNEVISGSIYIGKSKQMTGVDGVSVWTDRSGDKTDECINAVIQLLKTEQKEGKGYYGFQFESGAKLVFIEPNYKIEIKKEGD